MTRAEGISRAFRYCYYLLYILALPSVLSVTIEEGEFNSFAFVGRDSASNDEPTHVAVTKDDVLIIGGTSSPLKRMEESDLGSSLVDGLRQEDYFLAKIRAGNGSVEWVYRGGTSREDRMHAMLIDKDETHVYVGGRTFGQFSGTTRNGQSDIFIMKYNISGDKPTDAWSKPILLGTSASDAVTALAMDPTNDNVIYATGFTSGSLFPGREMDSSGLSDAILFSFYATNGSVIDARQFGTEFADQGTGIVVPDKPSGPIFVSVITERQIGQYAFGNFHMYKFRKDTYPLGDLLLRTYSREQMASFREHPMLPGTLVGSGSSWLDARNGYDVFVKRIVRPFDDSEIGSKAVDIDDVGDEEYTKRIRSADGSHDYASGMIVDSESGRLIISGYTAGAFAPGSSKGGILAPFLAAVDPLDASLTGAKQMQLTSERSWVEIACIAMTKSQRGIYYVAKESNETTNQFHLAIGSFGFPAFWKTPITIVASPDPTPSPKTDQDKSHPAQKSNPSIAIIAGAGVGGIALILAVIALAMGISMKKRSQTAKVYQPEKPRRHPSATKVSRERAAPTAGPKVEGSNASGLV